MVRLVVDSGGTKTRWVLTGDDYTVAVTAGLNPRLTQESDFRDAVRQMLAVLPRATEATEVWFYGAGCGTQAMQTRVAAWLKADLPTATVHVEGDMLGACRATCGHSAGLVGILGTGSNLCHYDGTRIDHQWPSTGYLLGDEGSGNHIGRCLLKDYLEETMPEPLSARFKDDYPLSREDFLQRLYGQPGVNRFLASFVPFAARHRDDPYIARMLATCFDAFMVRATRHQRATNVPLHLVGGLTAAFVPELHAAAIRHGLAIATFTPDPLPALRHYHAAARCIPVDTGL